MLRIFDRYLARQILTSTLFAVVVLSVVLVLGQIFRKLLDSLVAGSMSGADVLRFIGYSFPWSLSYTVPWGLLTAVLLTFGRLSADNELVSLRMTGLSLWRICLPVLLVATALSGLCLWINTVVAPHCYARVRQLTGEAVLRDPSAVMQPGRVIDAIPGHLIFAEKKEGDTLGNLQIILLEQGDSERVHPAEVIFSREGFIQSSPRSLHLDLHGTYRLGRVWPKRPTDEEIAARVESEAEGTSHRLQRPLTGSERSALETRVRLEAVEKFENAFRRPAEFEEFVSDSSPISVSLDRLVRRSSRVRTDGLSMRELKESITDYPAWQAKLGDIVVPAHSEMVTEFNRRISFSLACLVMALAGIPFGITAHRRETSAGFVLSLAVGIGYFALIMLGELWKDKAEKLPWLWVWLPNVVFGALGVSLFMRLQRR